MRLKKQQGSVLLKTKNSFCILFKPCLHSFSIWTSYGKDIKDIKLNFFLSVVYQCKCWVECDAKKRDTLALSVPLWKSPHCPPWSLTWSYNLVALPLPHPLSLSPTRASRGHLPRTTCSLSQGLLLEETKLNKAPLNPQPWHHWPFLGAGRWTGWSCREAPAVSCCCHQLEVHSPEKGMHGGSNRIKPCHPLPEQLGRAEFQNGRNGKGQA